MSRGPLVKKLKQSLLSFHNSL